MPPIVFISHSRVRDGMLDGLRAFVERGAPALQAAKPRTLAFLPYLSEDEAELAIAHVFADAESFTEHLEGVAARSSAAGEFIETVGYEVYGEPTGQVLDMLRAGAAAVGASVDVHPTALAGFLRAG